MMTLVHGPDGYWPPIYIKVRVVTRPPELEELIGSTGQLNVGVHPGAIRCETVFVTDPGEKGHRKVYTMDQLQEWEEWEELKEEPS
jgi:hypothetical protein